MIAPLIITQGDSVRLVVPITEGGNTVDVSGANNIIVVLYSGQTEVAKYALIPPSTVGYGTVVTYPNVEYFIEIQVERDQSKYFLQGPLLANIVIEFPDINMASGKRYETFRYFVANVKKGLSLNEY